MDQVAVSLKNKEYKATLSVRDTIFAVRGPNGFVFPACGKTARPKPGSCKPVNQGLDLGMRGLRQADLGDRREDHDHSKLPLTPNHASSGQSI